MVTLKSFALAAALAGASGTQGGETVLLDFNAPWCGPCRSMQPIVARLQAEGYPVREVNIDQNRQLASRFRVTSIPCFVMLVDGREVDRAMGATSYERLQQMVRSARTPTRPARPRPPAAPPVSTPPRLLPVPGQPAPPPTRRPTRLVPGSANTTPTHPTATDAGNIEAALLQSAVRIRVEDGTGRSYGTGTLVDARGDQALVLTCGHLFRDSQKDGTIFVELFLPDGVKTVPGHLIGYDLNRDIGLLSVRPGVPVRAARVAPKGHPVAPGDRVTNIGCNNGQPPTVRQTHVTAVDRYDGPPNIEAAGTPVEGRSGGGLFDQHGHVIGVCFAADASDNEGLYAGLVSIQAELDRLGLSSVYAAASTPPSAAATLADTPPPLPRQMPNATITPTAATQPTSPAHATPAVGNLAGGAAGGSDPRLSEAEQAALTEIGRRSQGAEVICIVRPSDPKAKSEIFVLENVSPEFIRKLTNAGPPRTAPSAAPTATSRLTSMSVPNQTNPRANVTARRANENVNRWRPKPVY